MISNNLVDTIKKLVTICHKQNVKIALMGGIATSLYARPRATYDIDGTIYLRPENTERFLSSLDKAGFAYDKNEPIKFIHGLPFITLLYQNKIYVDLFIAKNKFQREVLDRTRKINFYRMKIDVVSPEDLILIKLQTGRERDTEDVRELIQENFKKLDIRYLKRWAEHLGLSVFLKDEIKSLGLRW